MEPKDTRALHLEIALAKALKGMGREEFIRRFLPSEPSLDESHKEPKKRTSVRRAPLVDDVLMLDEGNTEYLVRLCEEYHQRPSTVLNALVTAARLGVPVQIYTAADNIAMSSKALQRIRQEEKAKVEEYHAARSTKPILETHWVYRERLRGVQIMCASTWFPKTAGLLYSHKPERVTCLECIEAQRRFGHDSDSQWKRWEGQGYSKEATPSLAVAFDGTRPYGDCRHGDDDALSAADLGLVAGDSDSAVGDSALPCGGDAGDGASAGRGETVPTEVHGDTGPQGSDADRG